MRVGSVLMFIGMSALSLSSCSRSGERSDVFDLKVAASAAQSMSSQVAPAAPATAADYVVYADTMGAASTMKLIDVSWKDAAGKTHNLADEAKGKIVVVNFWATWCPPCRREFPDLVEFTREHQDVLVVGVALEKDDETARESVIKFAEPKGVNYINIVSSARLKTRDIASAYANIAPMDYIPVTIVFGKSGQHATTIQGGTNKQGLIDAVAKAQQ